MTIWRNLTVAQMAGLGHQPYIPTKLKSKQEIASLLVNNGISIIGFIEVLLWNQELHCYQVLCKVTIANCFKDISAQTLGLSASKHGFRVSTVLHWVVCCVGWVHSCWVHFLWELPGCWNVMLARKAYICIIIVPGRLCSGSWRQQNCGKCFLCLLTWVYTVHWNHTVIWLNSLLLKITWGMASFSSLMLIKLSQSDKCRGSGTAYARWQGYHFVHRFWGQARVLWLRNALLERGSWHVRNTEKQGEGKIYAPANIVR